VHGGDFEFPHRLEGLPAKLSEFADLQVGAFSTGDGVTLSYWAAGAGDPLIIHPGWSGSGASFVNVLYLLGQHYRVYVLDPRNQGLSERVRFGTRIARLAMDLREFTEHLGLTSASYCGHSMGASVIWSYIDLFGTRTIRKAIFVDEAISIYSHADWSEQERLDAGGTTSSPERMIAGFGGAPTNSLIVDMTTLSRYAMDDSPYFVNCESFARAIVDNDFAYLELVLFDHLLNDWRDVVAHKIDVPAAVFSGEKSSHLPSQRWLASVIPDSTLHVYTEEEQGDHFLMFKNPIKFANDVLAFLKD
jgi:pimeloyl-ACP methyl ester carboxylesterase